jgi:ribosome biogenesis GTPase A
MADDALLEAVGRKRGALLPGGRVHLQKAAEALLTDFRSGALGRITLETPERFAAWLVRARQAEAQRLAERQERQGNSRGSPNSSPAKA